MKHFSGRYFHPLYPMKHAVVPQIFLEHVVELVIGLGC
jgi:hypothetical protein